jgi:hypothetical protein
MSVEFVREREGTHKRVRWERDIENTDMLVRIQNYLPHFVPDINLFRKENLHLTSFAFGRPDLLECDLRRNNPNLTEGQFVNDLKELLVKVSKLRLGPAQTVAGDLNIYGNLSRYFLVVMVRPTASLLAGRDFVVDNMRQILEDCGVRDPRDYMRTNPVWENQVPEKYSPHITLAQLRPQEVDFNFDVPDFPIRLTYPRLKNVRIYN